MHKTLKIPNESRSVRAFALSVDPGDALSLLLEIGALGNQNLAIVRRTREALDVAFELGRRLLTKTPPVRCQIRTPADVANLLLAEMGMLDQEELRVILLDTRNRVVGIPTIYRGSVNTTMIRVAEVFRDAIRHNCPSIVVVHNHPLVTRRPAPRT